MERPALQFIYATMADFYGMEFSGQCRRRALSDKRKMFCLVARRYGYSHRLIQEFLRWKSHGSVVVACAAMRDLMSVYPDFRRQYDSVIARIEDELNQPQVIENW